jgi:hypothetical protein
VTDHTRPTLTVITSNPRASFFLEVFERLHDIPIKGWLPVLAQLPGPGERLVYVMDLDRLTPDERARLVQNLARSFGDTTDIVAKELDANGVSILAEGTIVAIPLRLF